MVCDEHIFLVSPGETTNLDPLTKACVRMLAMNSGVLPQTSRRVSKIKTLKYLVVVCLIVRATGVSVNKATVLTGDFEPYVSVVPRLMSTYLEMMRGHLHVLFVFFNSRRHHEPPWTHFGWESPLNTVTR